MNRFAKTLVAATATALLTSSAQAGSCGGASHAHANETSRQDLVETAIAAGTFQTLATALGEAGLVAALQGEGPFTVFAPTDEAFSKLPEGTVESLLEPGNRAQLLSILKYHVVPGKVNAKDVVKVDGAITLNGQRVGIAVRDGNVSIDQANVTATDVEASNGVIHVIDTVLLPESDSIVSVASKAGSFETLVAAVKAAGLAETLMGEGPFTVFAPTDEAFAKLPEGTVESLLLEENRAKLQTILKYHVVSGRVFSDEVLTKSEVGTLAGFDVRVSAPSGTPMLNNAAIAATDINASNGVIHVIDTVLLPPDQHSSVSPEAPIDGSDHTVEI